MTSEREKKILHHLDEAWRLFEELRQFRDVPADGETQFANGLTMCQTVIAYHVAKSADPQTWR
jgi:hypothetical protein